MTYTVAEIANQKGMSKTNAWWHVRKIWSKEEQTAMCVKGVLKLNEENARKLIRRIDAVPELKKQARGKRNG